MLNIPFREIRNILNFLSHAKASFAKHEISRNKEYFFAKYETLYERNSSVNPNHEPSFPSPLLSYIPPVLPVSCPAYLLPSIYPFPLLLASILSCIHAVHATSNLASFCHEFLFVLNPFCPAFHLSCLHFVLPPPGPAYLLSCLPPVQHLSNLTLLLSHIHYLLPSLVYTVPKKIKSVFRDIT